MGAGERPTSRDAVLQAMAEFDLRGRADFLAAYGYGTARWFFVEHAGRLYDSKALAGVAIGYQRGAVGLQADDFTGGEQTVVRVMRRLGFNVQDARSDAILARIPPLLERGRVYTWDELGSYWRSALDTSPSLEGCWRFEGRTR